MILVWLQFAVLAVVIAIAGYWLSRCGEGIARRTNLSAGWIGVILLATVTSLPELVTGVSSVAVADSPDLGVGDILGSCAFNLLLLAVIDFAYRPACMYQRASQGHILSAGIGAGLIALVGLGMVAPSPFPHAPIGVTSVLIAGAYLLGLRTLYSYERRRAAAPAEPEAAAGGMSLRTAVTGYGLAALFVMGAGLFLPVVAANLAQTMGWSHAFAGTLFLAAATSLPELAVVLAAVRLNAVDMAVASLLGSNLFNVAILAVEDAAWTKGPLLQHVGADQLATILAVLAMDAIVIAALINRPRGRLAGSVSWASLALAAVYGLNLWLIWAGGD